MAFTPGLSSGNSRSVISGRHVPLICTHYTLILAFGSYHKGKPAHMMVTFLQLTYGLK